MNWPRIVLLIWSGVALPVGILIGKSIKRADKLQTFYIKPTVVKGEKELLEQIRFHAGRMQ